MRIPLLAILASLLVIVPIAALAGAPSAVSLGSLCSISETVWLLNSLNLDGSTLPSSPWYHYGLGTSAMVDLGGGNGGMTLTDGGTTGSHYSEWSSTYQNTRMALAACFRIDSEASSGNLLQLAGKGATPEVAIGIRDHRFAAINYKDNSVIADLGAVTLGQFYEGGLYVDVASGKAGWWLGAQGGNQVLTPTGLCSTAFVEFGASTYDAPGGTCTATYDWVGVYVPEPSSMIALFCGIGWLAARRRR